MRAFFVAGVLAASASVASAQTADRALQLQFHEDGTVSLSARNVTTSEILSVWLAECKCVVVNGNRLAGSVISTPVLFERAPQAVVLRSLLKQAGGYVLTPRRPGTTGPSAYETIYILPTAAPAAPFMTAGGGAGSAISFQPTQIPTAGAPDDEIPPVMQIRIPEPIDPSGTPTPEPSGPTPNAPPSGVSLPGVRVVPITPAGPSPVPSPSPGTPPTVPGGLTPARTP
jgi:hypothetical protein